MTLSVLSRLLDHGLALLAATGMRLFCAEGAFVGEAEEGAGGAPRIAQRCRSRHVSDFLPTA